MTEAAFTGFFTGFSLILAIGAQNAYVLRLGLLRQHVFALCLFCAVSDAILITAGVAGFGAMVQMNSNLPLFFAFGGAAFLFVYGGFRFREAWLGASQEIDQAPKQSFWAMLLTAAALTWLNPHVYLDTFGLIGAISTQYLIPSQKVMFGLGAVTASFTFFFSLGFGARFLAPLMCKPAAWRVFDTLVGLVMWAIAVKLLFAFS